jgi:signal transduction histidine kinase
MLLVAGDIAAAAVLAIGGALSALGLQPRPPLATVGLAVLCAAAVGWRRLAPESAFVVSVSALVAYQLLSHDPNMAFEPYAVALTAYMVGRRSPPRRILALAAIGMAILLVMRVHPAENSLSDTLGAWALFVAAAMVAGRLVARHHSMVVRLADVTARLRQDQDVRAARLAAEERTRVARELHDVTAHSVSVMVIQASAARLLATVDQHRARQALRIAARSGREAMDDLRRIMGVLRRGEDDLVGVLPDDRGVEDLISRSRAAGLDVRFAVRGDTSGLAADTRFVLYRVVQEALTNAARHGGSGPVSVTVSADGDGAVVAVANALGGEAPKSATQVASGHGLVGMRERVAMLGGELSAGATDSGTFRVEARLPAAAHAGPPAFIPPPSAEPAGDPPAGLDARFGPRAVDLAVAGFWLVALGLDVAVSGHRSGSLALNLAAVAAMSLGCIWRRRYPIAFSVLVGGAGLLMMHGMTSRNYGTLVGLFTVTVPQYTVGAWAERRRALAYLVAFEIVAAGMGLFEHASSSGIAGPALLGAVAWLAGRALRRERMVAERLRQGSRRLVEEEADHARLAVIGERARLARDLHGLAARQVNAMVVQTEMAERLLGFDQRRLEDAMEAVEQTGRAALTQMRATVGVLRADGDRAPLAPQPGVSLVHALVRESRECGRDVHLSVQGEPFPLPPAVDLIAYRILEDALAVPGPSGSIEARLRFADGAVEIELRSGTPQAWPTVAMRERVELCNGRLEITSSGGRSGRTQLVASLPLAEAALAP